MDSSLATNSNSSCKFQQWEILNHLQLKINSITAPYAENPSCRHTTLASLLSQKLSQTVPHRPFTQISILPDLVICEPLSCNAPSTQCSAAKIIWPYKFWQIINTRCSNYLHNEDLQLGFHHI